ncbi:MAG: BON domain-containing protein [Deltaproteobacteria bacterium]|nr:BON domain-containing protein [Deltaproteobacteria bacterium]MBW2078150.1 BON domain-containing protein [Deltaproteobacteria bacterium]MBW2312185.1 BON domain-containing protein [Deltaproteobacteria bacterium]
MNKNRSTALNLVGKTGTMILLGGVLLAFVFLSQARAITDRDITWEVLARLIEDEWVSSHFIEVETEGGIVTLSGPVEDLLSKEHAPVVARSVKGVRGVINRIRLLHGDRSDAHIKAEIEEALLDDTAAELNEVTIKVRDGFVRLTGTVDSLAEKQLCERIAKSVRGVVEVETNLKVFDGGGINAAGQQKRIANSGEDASS